MDQAKPAKRKWWLWAVAGIVLLIIIGAIIPDKGEGETAPETVSAAVDTTTQTPQEMAAAMIPAGLGKTREEFVDAYELFPYEVEFKKGAPIEGQDNYVGAGEDGIIVQLIGPEDDLQRASITLVRDGGRSKKSLSNLSVIAFLSRFGADESNWAIDEIRDKGERLDWEEEKSFGSHAVNLTSFSMRGAQSLTVTVKSKR